MKTEIKKQTKQKETPETKYVFLVPPAGFRASVALVSNFKSSHSFKS